MQDIRLNTELILVEITFMIATVINKKVAYIITNFLPTQDKNLYNDFFYHNYST